MQQKQRIATMTNQNDFLFQLSETIVTLNDTIDQLNEELDEAEFVLETTPLMVRRDKLKSEFNRLSTAALKSWQTEITPLLAELEACNAELTIKTEKLEQTIETIDKINAIMSYTDQVIKLAASVAV
jgi:DNA repair exonuclease SbcCD ATPase subunit